MLLGSLVFSLIAAMFFAWRRTKRYLHVYQQDEYDAPRFLRWVFSTGAVDKRVSLVLALISGVIGSWGWPDYMAPLGVGLCLGAFGFFEPNPTKTGKKPLVMTKRAVRVFAVSLLLSFLVGAVVAGAGWVWLWILFVQLIPFALTGANALLDPFEKRVQKRFWNEAHERLLHINPKIIGITGSFGKTSIKHILGHVLSMSVETAFAPGSINTPMGISRFIREKLSSACECFIVEMGAYGRGSIARLCRLTPPHVGIITALGHAHYERFKGLDALARAKFELAEAVLARADGRVLIHSSVLDQSYAREFVEAHRDRFIVCGATEGADVQILSWAQKPEGLEVVLTWSGATHRLVAPLYGEQQVGNIALAFAAAVTLGLSADYVLAALASTPQIKHRLEIKPQGDGTVWIDDAYNSNQRGFVAALELLSYLAKNRSGRRILVTPGLVELGAEHDKIHEELGKLAAVHADLVFVIRPERIQSFIKGFNRQGEAKNLVEVSAMAEALNWIKENAKSGDAILLENDLPDLYERKLTL